MKRWIIWLLVIMTIPVSASSAGEIERIVAKGEIVVSLNKGYPPFAMDIEGRLTGLDVDLAMLIGGYLGVDVRFIQPELYEEQIPRLLSGESDIIIAAMTRTAERGLKVNFTEPYFEVSQAALVLRSKAGAQVSSYFDLTDIHGLRLGVKAGTTHENFARELFKTAVIRTFPTADAAAAALVDGDVDAMVADSPFVQVWRATHPQHYTRIKALLIPVTREHYSMAVRKGDADFLNWLNLFISQISTDGTLDLLKYEYFDQMAWAGIPTVQRDKMTKSVLLKNKFIQNRKKALEQQRRRQADRGDAYE